MTKADKVEKGRYQYNLRSRGDFDVSEVAKQFGGGGHAGASGMIARLLALFRRRLPAPLPPRPADVPKMSAATVARLMRNSNAIRRAG